MGDRSPATLAGRLLALAVVACNGSVAPAASNDADADRDGSIDGALTTQDSVVTVEPHGTACPSSAPVAGSRCPCAFSCEYGSDPDVRCDVLMTGSHGVWTIARPALSAGCPTTSPAPAPAGCPRTRPRIGTWCATEKQSCDYGACRGNVNLTCIDKTWEDTAIDCSL